MRSICERSPEVAGALCARTGDLPLADRAMEFMSWKEHGIHWLVSLMVGVVP